MIYNTAGTRVNAYGSLCQRERHDLRDRRNPHQCHIAHDVCIIVGLYAHVADKVEHKCHQCDDQDKLVRLDQLKYICHLQGLCILRLRVHVVLLRAEEHAQGADRHQRNCKQQHQS